jgi:hypothetical protein
MTFQELGLSPELSNTLAEKGYTTPTPIQEQVIPLILRGSDILACAPTGTGKTAAFALPMIDMLSEGRTKARVPRSLILEPTRELAHQVADNFAKYTKNHKLNVALLIGGESIANQERILNRGVDVLIVTPGRFLDLYGSGKILLTDIRMLVLDEADRMMDMGFMPDIKRIMAVLPPMKQTLLLSATLPPEIRRLSADFLMSPKEVVIKRSASEAAHIEQFVIPVDLDKSSSADQFRKKGGFCQALIKNNGISSAIIFCNRKRDVDNLYKVMRSNGFATETLHGDLSQGKRNRAIAKIKSGESTFLVASDVAARGLDISGLPCVINFDVPTSSEDYVHRIGRTGRAGAKGLAFTFVTQKEQKGLKAIERLIGKTIEVKNMQFASIPLSPSPQKFQQKAQDAQGKNKSYGASSRDKVPSRKKLPNFGADYPNFLR